MTNMLKFEHPKNQSNIIKVIGVGGGGNNAVTHMAQEGIKGVDFVICNTDAQALEKSPVPNKIHLGKRNLGAGNIPSVGRDAAMETVEEIRDLLSPHTKMLFITAGMGGGTGTGAAPIVAEIARELEILTVGIVTIPFSFEGKKRRQQALEGIEELRKHVDTLLIISNDKLREEYGNMRITEAFKKADDVLAIAARGIAEIITVTGYINVDFEDVKTVMKNSGKAIMGSSYAEGENRAIAAIEDAMRSPLLNDSNIAGAKNILLYITSGKEEVSLDEVHEITDFIQQTCGNTAEVIWGNGTDEDLNNKIGITVIATGFESEEDLSIGETKTHVIVNELYGSQPSLSKRTETKTADQQTQPLQQTEKQKPPLESLRFHDEEISIREIHTSPENNPKPFKVHQLFGEIDQSDKKEKIEEATGMSSKVYPKQTEEREENLFAFSQKTAPENKKTEGTFKPAAPITHDEKAEMDKKSAERQSKLKDMSMKLKSVESLNELEKQPAYLRKGIKLAQNEADSTKISRYSIDGNLNRPGLRSDNSYLHDNVD
jgi:cell division protein FtsZ